MSYSLLVNKTGQIEVVTVTHSDENYTHFKSLGGVRFKLSKDDKQQKLFAISDYTHVTDILNFLLY